MDIIEYFSSMSLVCGIVPVSECKINRPYLIERAGFTPVSVIMIAAPYRCAPYDYRNISIYAVPRDYHGFFRTLFESCVPELEKAHPGFRFAEFADHSPIAEVDAAQKAGLGVIGENNLLINPTYGSYIFLGEILTDLTPEKYSAPVENRCLKCGKCRMSCPDPNGCLSALTQKKGVLTPDEEEKIRKTGCAWGCDICQSVCPMNKSAKLSSVGYFKEGATPHITTDLILGMSDKEFGERAYSWRGRECILRNLRIIGC